MDRYWRAANYLSVGQIYLLDNPLLREPLTTRAHQAQAARSLGYDARSELHLRPHEPDHPGLRPEHDLRLRAGARWAGHGRERVSRGHVQRALLGDLRRRRGDEAAVQAVLVPGRDPESRRTGGARGRSTRAASSGTPSRTRSAPPSTTPTCSSTCIVGDGEAETGPLAASWHSNKFLNPARDGAVLPILHLNGYKIANPTLFARIDRKELESLFVGLRVPASLRRGRRPSHHASPDGVHPRHRRRRDQGDPARSAGEREHSAAGVAHDRPQDAEGLDRAEGGRRQEDRGFLALAPGADGRDGVPTRSTSRCSISG